MSVFCRLASGGGVGGFNRRDRRDHRDGNGGKRNFFPRISRIFTDGRGARDFYPQISQISTDGVGGGRWTEDGRRRTEDRGMGERIDSFKELRVYKEAWALNLEVLLLGTICVNL